jgi:hypothetical protein
MRDQNGTDSDQPDCEEASVRWVIESTTLILAASVEGNVP